jgi:RNA polymerase sigma-70 factor (ECF subfamily)
MVPVDTANTESSSNSSIRSSLLERVREHDEQAWRRLVDLFSPLIYDWCRGQGLQAADAADVMQEVFRSVAANAPP